MIKITLSKDEFEYEIHALVKAFYPGEQIKVLKPLPINYVHNEVPVREKGGQEEESSLESTELQIIINSDEDIIKIVAIRDTEELYSDTGHIISSDDKKQYRNYLKRILYGCLSSLTGKELPWGTLTGVRPTKIAFERMEHQVPKIEIEAFMREQYLCSKEKTEVSLQVAELEVDLLLKMDYKNGYSVYIGIPFCPSTCVYCSFTSYSLEKYAGMVEQYLQALFKEITYAGTCYRDKKLSTVYLGGGTPTTLSAGQLDRLLTHIRNSFDFTHVMEYTVEAGRPDSITPNKLKVLKAHEVTRISINPQSMRQNTLDIIGRKHSVEQLIEAYQLARELGHENINMDIILGLPGETKEDVAYTLQEIDKLKPDSLTVHTLAIKRAARLNLEKTYYQNMVPTDTIEMLQLTSDYTKKAGYIPYYLYRQKNMADNLENIGYAKPGKEGLYNILIMEEKQTILALGAGALSKFVFHEENRIERVENVKSLKDYIERIDEMIERKRNFLHESSRYKEKGNSDVVRK